MELLNRHAADQPFPRGIDDRAELTLAAGEVVSDRFDTRRFPMADRLSKLEEHLSGGQLPLLSGISVKPLSSQNENIHIQERLFGHGAYLSFVKSSGGVVTFDRRGLDARNDTVTVTLLTRGRAEARTGRDQFTLAAGDIYINASTSVQTTFSDNEAVRLIFPAGPKKELFRRTGEFVVIRDYDPVWHLLKSTISGLEAALRADGASSVNLLSRMAVDLASTVVEENIFRSAVTGNDVIRELAREYIHDNIASPNLKVDDIAASVGASRASLYRAFESLGGVREYINFVRLERAKSMIGVGTPDRRGIANIAFACGFTSPGQMGKAFKRRYGISPTQFGITICKDWGEKPPADGHGRNEP